MYRSSDSLPVASGPKLHLNAQIVAAQVFSRPNFMILKYSNIAENIFLLIINGSLKSGISQKNEFRTCKLYFH